MLKTSYNFSNFCGVYTIYSEIFILAWTNLTSQYWISIMGQHSNPIRHQALNHEYLNHDLFGYGQVSKSTNRVTSNLLILIWHLNIKIL